MSENPYHPPKHAGTQAKQGALAMGKILVRLFLSALIAAMVAGIGWDLLVERSGCLSCGFTFGIALLGTILALHIWLA